MKVKIALVADAAEILALQKKCYLQEAAIYEDYTLPPLLQTLPSIRADFEHQIFLKITKDTQIIGSVRGRRQKDTCYIGRLIVALDFQNK